MVGELDTTAPSRRVPTSAIVSLVVGLVIGGVGGSTFASEKPDTKVVTGMAETNAGGDAIVVRDDDGKALLSASLNPEFGYEGGAEPAEGNGLNCLPRDASTVTPVKVVFVPPEGYESDDAPRHALIVRLTCTGESQSVPED